MSSFLISKLSENLSKENLDTILEINDDEILEDISKFIFLKNDKDSFLFLIQHDKIPKNASYELFRFIVEKKYWDVLYKLDYNKYDIHTCSDYLLVFSSENGQYDIVKYLIENGADIYALDCLAIRMASIMGYIDIVKLLIEKDNSQKMCNKAFECFSFLGNIELVKYFLDNGADVHSSNDYAVRTASQKGYLEIVKYLVENGANIHADNDRAFLSAIQHGHFEVVKYLVEKGANIHANNDDAVRLAIQYKNFEIVKYLVENGIDIHALEDLSFKLSIIYGHIDITKFLISTDLEYFSKKENAIDIVKKYKLYEFYEPFGICDDDVMLLYIKDIKKYINTEDIDSLKNNDKFNFSYDHFLYFFKALDTNNYKMTKIIFDKIQNKENLKNVFDKISPFFDQNKRNIFDKLYKIYEMSKNIES